MICKVTVDTGNLDNFVALEIEVRNKTDENLYFLDRQNPWSNNDNEFFQVVQGEAEVDYFGPVMKYDAPDRTRVVELAVGDSRKVVYPLSDFYDFDAAGAYTATPMISLPVVSTGTPPEDNPEDLEFEPQALSCNAVKFELSKPLAQTGFFASFGDQPPRLCNPTGPGYPRRPCIPDIEPRCDEVFSEQAVYDLHVDMWLKGHIARRAFEEAPASALEEFFGVRDVARYDRVHAALKRIISFYQYSVIAYHCLPPGSGLCGNGVVAFVVPSWEWPDIFLCPKFYAALRDEGFDSQVGTLVHESTHFRSIGTEDYAYGLEGARGLASNTPERAIDNADNYQYFYESNRSYLVSADDLRAEDGEAERTAESEAGSFE